LGSKIALIAGWRGFNGRLLHLVIKNGIGDVTILSKVAGFYFIAVNNGFGDLPVSSQGRNRSNFIKYLGTNKTGYRIMKAFPPLKSAKRFTGDSLSQYSPRGLLLYFLPLALIPAAVIGLLKGQVMTVLVNAAAFTLYCLAAICLRKGLKAENAGPRNRLDTLSRWPLKLLSAILVAFTTGLLAALGAHQSWTIALLYAGGAFLGMYLSYGFDSRQRMPIPAADGYSADEIHKTLADAYAIINSIDQANRAIRHDELNQRIASICQIAEGVIADLEADPRGIRRARKFLNVYLENVQQVIQGYAKTHQQTTSQALEHNFRQALEAIESAFLEQQQKLLEEDVFDLDVKIEVLTAQLKREGIM